MDNEDKVRDLSVRGKNIFLKDVIQEMSHRRQLYNLEDEYEKTRKNKSVLVPVIIAAFIAIVALGAVLLTNRIQAQAGQVNVSISGFEEVNLREILDTAKRYENELQQAERELEAIVNERDERIETVKSEIERRIEIVNNQELSAAVRTSRINEIKQERAAKIEEIEASFAGRIDEQEEKIEDIEERIAEYDSRQLEQARRQEQVINNQQRLFDIEMEKTVNYYESRLSELEANHRRQINEIKSHNEELVSLLKENHRRELNRQFMRYNPNFKDPQLRRILQSNAGSDRSETALLREYRQVLDTEGVISRGGIEDLHETSRNLFLIVSRLQKIPYRNSVDLSIDRIEAMQEEMLGEYEMLRDELSRLLEEKNLLIEKQRAALDRFRYAVEDLTLRNSENGYIIDPRDSERIVLYVNSINPLEEGDTAYVFRRDDELLGTVTVYKEDNRWFARLNSLAGEEASIQPFDKILLDIQ
ncbi:MAG: hypothetical protein K9L68_02030 [Spirochaetales bacterium]|nr:hypothetical protein [Spirochaetales bacterium]MCF7937357.1 hypothetical protein [Spirochaetales bacterium]